MRNFTKKLCSPTALLPVVLLEGTVTAGRTYQAEKRGGKIEARERLTEECVTGVIWLFGMGWLNKGFDFAIDKFSGLKKRTGLKDFNFDTGKDSVRRPFENATKGLDNSSKNLISALKFSKIIASAAIAVGFMGFALPKINQKITANMVQKTSDNNKKIDTTSSNSSKKEQTKSPRVMDMTTFLSMARGDVGDPRKKEPKFKGGSFFEMAVHQLEENSVAQLLTFDTGLFAGRAVNARNKYERREILFRDIASSFFYVGATPLIYSGLLKLDALKGKNTALSSNGAQELHGKILKVYGDKKSMKVNDFERQIKGKRQVPKEVLDDAHTLFDGSVVTKNVDDIHKFIDEKASQNILCIDKNSTALENKQFAKTLKEKATKLSAIQPELNGRKIMTKSQMNNLFHDGLMNEPEVINNLINDATEGKAMDPIKYVSQKNVDKYRKHIKDYVESIVDKANKEGVDEISTEFLTKMKNRNLITKLGYWGAGMAVSAYFLSTAIPKMQYKLTREATGRDEFPGVVKYDEK